MCIAIFGKNNIDQFLDVDWSPGHINIISLKLFQICRIDTLKVSTGNPSNINLEEKYSWGGKSKKIPVAFLDESF